MDYGHRKGAELNIELKNTSAKVNFSFETFLKINKPYKFTVGQLCFGMNGGSRPE